MKIEEILNKKEKNQILSYEELSYFFNSYLDNTISDEVMTKMLKLICKYELTINEIFDLTDIFIKSGDTLDLSKFDMVVDKHSTGGVGDKTTLIVAPIVAANDIKIAKMSGRALGYTGGTIDKLESIKGFNVNLKEEEFLKEINDINMSIISQTKQICPMDKKVYALRDVTNTTNSISLIATSIMSKKISSGAKIILIDLKVGKGALVKNIKDARLLANIMIEIGKKYNRIVKCMLTRMDDPLGDNIGNAIEVMEVIDILKNNKKNTLTNLCIEMSSLIIHLAKNVSMANARKMVIEKIKDKSAYKKFEEFVKFQKGDLKSLKKDNRVTKYYAKKSGYIKSINARTIGEVSMSLGAGRVNKEDKINYQAGIILNKSITSYVKKGELLCTLYGKKDYDTKKLDQAFKIGFFKPKTKNIVIEII